MLKLLRNIVLCAAAVPLLIAAGANQASAADRPHRRSAHRRAWDGHRHYWNGYWSWYDGRYRPYWNRRYRLYRRSPGYYNYGYGYYPGYTGYYTPYYNYPGRGVGVSIGPFRFSYRDWD